jgi:uncharacterized membrane protein YcaP (DUF421 family)
MAFTIVLNDKYEFILSHKLLREVCPEIDNDEEWDKIKDVNSHIKQKVQSLFLKEINYDKCDGICDLCISEILNT